MTRRRRLAPALAVGLVLLWPAAAGAHGGSLLASAVAGPYRVQVTGAPLVEAGRPPAIDVTVYLTTTGSSTPVDDARVRTTVTADGRSTAPPVRRIAGGYEAIVPVRDAYAVGEQRIDVAISGPLGTGRVTIDPTPGDGGPPAGLLAATVAALAGLALLALRVRRRRALEVGDA